MGYVLAAAIFSSKSLFSPIAKAETKLLMNLSGTYGKLPSIRQGPRLVIHNRHPLLRSPLPLPREGHLQREQVRRRVLHLHMALRCRRMSDDDPRRYGNADWLFEILSLCRTCELYISCGDHTGGERYICVFGDLLEVDEERVRG